MTYNEISRICEQKLHYRDKLRLAQLLIQQARKEEEIENPQQRVQDAPSPISGETTQEAEPSETLEYVIERLLKLKPSKKSSLVRSISSMFQFRGGISDTDIERIITELQHLQQISIDSRNKVTYP